MYCQLNQTEMNTPVTFVSLGPGDPELITWKALKSLQAADVVFCPATQLRERTSSRAMDILQALDIDRAKIETFYVPMSKDRTKALESYRAVTGRIIDAHNTGKMIVVTAEGDAGFYSSIHYISDNLREVGIPVLRIAGVPAFIAAGALANLHVVKQEEKLLVVPGTADEDMLRLHFKTVQTIVIMKPSQCEEAIKVMCTDPHLTFHYFENVGLPDKEYYTSDTEAILARTFPYFSLLVIHQ